MLQALFINITKEAVISTNEAMFGENPLEYQQKP
jgi:hypothetical protein